MKMIPIARPIMEEEEKKAVMEVLSSGMLAQGKKVEELEKRFADYCEVKYAAAVNSGTAALHTALYALGIGKGDTVITTPFTFVATANSILMQNANVAFSDIKPDTFNIDSQKINITPETRAITAVDLFGQLADYERIEALVEEHNLRLIEDSAQAIGAEYKGRKAGSFGDIACFSLYATKNLTSGEGGMITTDDEDLWQKAKMFRSHGQGTDLKYHYNDLGFNYRMTEISAAIALEQLKKVDRFNEIRRENAKILTEVLADVPGVITPFEKPEIIHVFHQYTIMVDRKKRDNVVQYLKKNEIGWAVFYPEPLHLSGHLEKFGYKEGDFPIAEDVSKRVISLPIHPSVSEPDLETIANAVREALS
jgi:dTDP-4-amino-4,6-dideoxygalactose transaminase